MINFRYGDINSYHDYYLYIEDMEIGQPELNSIYVSVPYSNATLDFTDIYGSSTYSDRTIKITLSNDLYPNLTRTELNAIYDAYVNDIRGKVGKQEIKIDTVSGTFKGRVVKVSALAYVDYRIKFTIEITCDPFRTADVDTNLCEIWDDINQFSAYTFSNHDCTVEINGRNNITINTNSVTDVECVIAISDNPLTIIKDGVEYPLAIGESKFKLSKGDNDLTLVGDSSKISMKWRRLYV